MNKKNRYFSKNDIVLWISSAALVMLSFLIFDRENYLTLAASLIGVSSLIFCAKGNPIGQLLMIIFSIIYGIISFEYKYYGEMMTYLGMTAPMALFALISWLKNPYNGKHSEVKIGRLRRWEYAFLPLLTIAVTVCFYFVLSKFGTANIIPSTLSVTTSFAAVYLTFRRSPYFAVAYALNDMILIILWIMATVSDFSYISVVVCFVIFWVNDIYGFFSWQKMKARQNSGITIV